MSKPMFLYAGVCDSVADADADYEAIKALHAGAGLGAWFGHLAHGTSRGEPKEIGALLDGGDAALVVVGIDNHASRVEKACTRVKDHVLKREFGDFDEAQQEALQAIADAERAG